MKNDDGKRERERVGGREGERKIPSIVNELLPVTSIDNKKREFVLCYCLSVFESMI